MVSKGDGSPAVAISPASPGYLRGGWFSPSGAKVAFAWAANGSGVPDIYTTNPDGTALLNVTKTDATSETWVTWSPSGNAIAMVNNPPGAGSGIAIVNADGTGFRQLTENASGVSDANPVWSPDGTKIAFDSNRSGTRGIWVVSVSGGLPSRYTPLDMFAVSPQWGADGRIAFAGSRPAALEQDIWVITADRSRLTRVTTNPGHEFGPFWKP
jgi:TolB protein